MEGSAAVVAEHNPVVVEEIAGAEDNPVANKKLKLGELHIVVVAEGTLVVLGEQVQTRSIRKNLGPDCNCQWMHRHH